MIAATHGLTEAGAGRLGPRLLRHVGLLFLAALVLAVLDVALVVARARPDALATARYALVTVAACAWTALLCGAAVAALATLGSGALDRLAPSARARVALTAAGYGLLLGGACVVLIRPWNLHYETLPIALGVPIACTAGAGLSAIARAALPPRAFALLGLIAAVAAFLADATLYRGLYVTLHRALFLIAWVTAAVALSALAPMSRRGLRRAAVALAAVAQLALGAATEARELGVLHGALQPKLVALVQSLLDRDGDGYAAAFGGGDCNDATAEVYPGRCERHGNRIDDNCNGAIDARPPPRAGIVRSPRAPLPDVYVLLLDTVRADFGAGPGESAKRARWPSLNALARQSLDFTRAYAPYPATYRSLLATLSSRSPRQLDPAAPELLGLCARAGYDTQLWIARDRLAIGPSTVRGWSRHDNNPFQVRGAAPERWTEDMVEAAISELAEAPAGPPRLRWLHLLDAHDPWLHAKGRGAVRERYRAELAHLSTQVARLLAALAQHERGRRAVIAVFADHGEQLGEHGTYFHDAYLWEESIHVPLILRLPGVTPRVIAQPASLLDLAPTLAAYLGLAAPASFQGHDWLAQPTARADPPVAEVSGNDSFGGVGRPARHAVIGPRYKLTLDLSANLFELYDLARDPHELRPLALSAVPAAAGLRAFLARWQDAPGCSAP